ncbi:MAG: phage major capsid protein [Xanthobacteraceae bacterium]|nr:phage major capsid protein [Xanthobacteraceae bacterium]
MTKHYDPVVFKSDGEADPVEVVTKAIDELSKTVDARLKALETTKSEPEKKGDKEDVVDLKAIVDRLDKVEAKANRPGTSQKDNDDVVTKAFSSFLRTGSDVELKAAVSSSNPDGGYFVIPTVDTNIRNVLADVSPMRALAEVVTIDSNTFERYYSTGNSGAVWVGEKTLRPQDTARPQLQKQTYGVCEMYAAPAASRQLFEDASFDIAAWFNTWVANDMATAEGTAFLNGDGIDGKPRGLLTYPIVATDDKTRPWGSMQYLPAGHASAPTDDNWAKALVALVLTVRPEFRANGKFLMNTATLIRLKQIQDSNKRFMWSDGGNIGDSPNGYILGFPVFVDNGMPSIGENAFPVAFGDFKAGYTIVARQGIRVERDAVTVKGVIQLDSYMRVGGGLGDSRGIKFLKVATS